MPILLFAAFLFFIQPFALSNFCTPPLMLSDSATIPRPHKAGGITETTHEETCYLSITYVSKILYNITTATWAQHPVW